MKRLLYIILVATFQPLISHSYTDSLNTIINQRMKTVGSESLFDVVAIAQQIDASISNKVSLQEIHDLIVSKSVASFFLLDSSESINDLKFALGAKIYLYCLDCCEQKLLHKSLKMYDSLDYWQHEQFYENRDFFQKNIVRWVNNENYKQVIHNKITHLQSVSTKTLSLLGLVRHSKGILSQAIDRQSFEENLMATLYLQDDFLEKCEREHKLFDIYYVITTIIEQAYALNSDLSAEYIQCQPPQNLERNFVAYSSTAAGLCACAVTYYMYKNDIDTSVDLAYKAGTAFFNDKVERPLIKMWNTLAGNQNEPLVDNTREQQLFNALLERGDASTPRGADVSHVAVAANESYRLAGQATEYVAESFDIWSWFGYPAEQKTSPSVVEANGSQQNMTAEQLQAMRSRVTDKDSIILTYPEKNPRDVLPAILRSVFNPILEGQKAFNQLYEEHQLILGVGALLPFMAITGGTITASKKVYYSASYQPIRRTIRDLEIFLNDSVLKTTSFDREGKLYFLTELLKKKCGALSLKEYKLMEEDIGELQSKNLSYLQKFNIVQRMYHTYAFLLPGAV